MERYGSVTKGSFLAAFLPTAEREASVPTIACIHARDMAHSPQTRDNPFLATVTENSHGNSRYEDSNRNHQSHPTVDDQLPSWQDFPNRGHCIRVVLFYYQLASLALWPYDIRQNHSIDNFSFQDGQICLKRAVGQSCCHCGIKRCPSAVG